MLSSVFVSGRVGCSPFPGYRYIEVDRLEYDPDAFLLFSDKLHRWLADDTDAAPADDEETAV